MDIINNYAIRYFIAPDPCKGKTCGDMCVAEGDMAGGRCNSKGQCVFNRKNLGCGKTTHFNRKSLLCQFNYY